MLNTQKVQDIFHEILDVNSELTDLDNQGIVNVDYLTKWERKEQLLVELETEMGTENYNRFMNMGKAMFASKI